MIQGDRFSQALRTEGERSPHQRARSKPEGGRIQDVETYRMMPRGSSASSSSSSEDFPASSPSRPGMGGASSSARSCCLKKSKASPSSRAWLGVSRTETSLLVRSAAPGDLVPVEGEGGGHLTPTARGRGGVAPHPSSCART